MTGPPMAWFDEPHQGAQVVPGQELRVAGWISLPGPPADPPRLLAGEQEVNDLSLHLRADVEEAHPGRGWVRGFALRTHARASSGPSLGLQLQVDGETLARVELEVRPLAESPGRAEVFLIGAPGAGVPALAANLDHHPKLCVARPASPWYFTGHAEHRLGPSYYWTRHFPHHQAPALAVDACPLHLSLPWAAERIHAHNPDARLVAVLRHPVERLLVDLRAGLLAGGSPDLAGPLGIEQARDRAGQRLTPAMVDAVLSGREIGPPDPRRLAPLAAGDYAPGLRRYQDLFGKERVTVILYQELQRSPVAAVYRLLQWLQLAPMPADAPCLGLPSTVRRGWRSRLLGDDLRQGVAPDVLEFLAAYYRPRVHALEQLLGRDSGWRI